MWPYWFMFIIPAFAALNNARQTTDQPGSLRFTLKRGWWLIALLTLLIGYRYQVGGDWGNYARSLQGLGYRDLAEALAGGDPGYRLIEWLSVQYGWGVYGVNVIGAALFSFGLVVFCRNLPRPWLALTVAIPYMVIVLGMGYTRQGIATGLAMLGLVALGRQSVRKFVFWVLLGITFHKSALLLLPIAALAATQKRLWTAIWVAVIVAGAYSTFLVDSVDTLYAGYIDAEYQSQGAFIRLLMNAVPAVILLIWRRNFAMNLAQMRLWTWFALISLALLAGYFVTPASTALDRVALYMLPLQLAVFAYVPEVFGGERTRNQQFVAAIVAYYALVLFVWLNFATHSQYWIPYRNWLFV